MNTGSAASIIPYTVPWRLEKVSQVERAAGGGSSSWRRHVTRLKATSSQWYLQVSTAAAREIMH